MLQNRILEVKKQNVANQSEIKELEQDGRGQCLRQLRKTKLVPKC